MCHPAAVPRPTRPGPRTATGHRRLWRPSPEVAVVSAGCGAVALPNRSLAAPRRRVGRRCPERTVAVATRWPSRGGRPHRWGADAATAPERGDRVVPAAGAGSIRSDQSRGHTPVSAEASAGDRPRMTDVRLDDPVAGYATPVDGSVKGRDHAPLTRRERAGRARGSRAQGPRPCCRAADAPSRDRGCQGR